MKINFIENRINFDNSLTLIPVTEEKTVNKSLIGARAFKEIQNVLNKFEENLLDVLNLWVENRLVLLFKIKKLDEISLMKLGSTLSGSISKYKYDEINFFPPEILFKSNKTLITKHILEGMFFGIYKFNGFKTEKVKSIIRKIHIVTKNKKFINNYENIVRELPIIFKFVNLCRDLVNLPPSELTPENFANKIKISKASNLEIDILDDKAILEKGYNLIYTVGKGSKNPPFFAKLTYTGDSKSSNHIALVGKGVTFDSGGTNLKPTGHIETMKMDMAGAALMYSLTMLIAEIKLPVNIKTYLPLVENILGQNSYKPGDIIKSASGKTVEILNTDAEGRLILADALFEASKQNPNLIIDAATLTGACIIALGSYCAGFFSNDEKLADSLKKASNKTGETIWQLPLLDIYKSRIKGQNADLCNIAKQKGEAGSTMAAMFLKEFIEDKKWIHLDIAGPAFLNESHPIFGSGASGFGVRLLFEFITNMIEK